MDQQAIQAVQHLGVEQGREFYEEATRGRSAIGIKNCMKDNYSCIKLGILENITT
jgi:hypothetical protein